MRVTMARKAGADPVWIADPIKRVIVLLAMSELAET